MLIRDRGKECLQAASNKHPGEQQSLGFGDRQCPDEFQRHHEKNRIGQDVGNLLAIVILGGVEAGSGHRWIPKLVDWKAEQDPHHTNAQPPQDDKSGDDIGGENHPRSGE